MNTTISEKDYLEKVGQVITSEEPNYLKLAYIYNIVKSYEGGETLPSLPALTKSKYSQEKEVFDLM